MRSACSTSSASGNVHGGRWWTLRGRQRPRPQPRETAKEAAKQEEIRSPLTDSNRRPPPYHGGALPTELRGRAGLTVARMNPLVSEGFVDYRGYRTWYRVVGDSGSGAVPLLALHGGPGSTHHY